MSSMHEPLLPGLLSLDRAQQCDGVLDLALMVNGGPGIKHAD